VSTGNTSASVGGFTAPTEWSGGEAVFRLGAGPTFSQQTADYYYPANWAAMDKADQDLGCANPLPVDLTGDDGSVQRLVVAMGKDGNIYLLDRDNLGGMGTQLSTTSIAAGELAGAPATYTTQQGTYVAYRVFRGTTKGCPAGQAGGNLGVVRLVPGGAPVIVWCSSQLNLGSPMVTSSGSGDVIVWDANTQLYGYDGDTGNPVFNGGSSTDVMASGIQYFNTPIGANGRMVVATSAPGHLYVFGP
jgi:hypothetical protein